MIDRELMELYSPLPIFLFLVPTDFPIRILGVRFLLNFVVPHAFIQVQAWFAAPIAFFAIASLVIGNTVGSEHTGFGIEREVIAVLGESTRVLRNIEIRPEGMVSNDQSRSGSNECNAQEKKRRVNTSEDGRTHFESQYLLCRSSKDELAVFVTVWLVMFVFRSVEAWQVWLCSAVDFDQGRN